jgi:hypothetical protein
VHFFFWRLRTGGAGGARELSRTAFVALHSRQAMRSGLRDTSGVPIVLYHRDFYGGNLISGRDGRDEKSAGC